MAVALSSDLAQAAETVAIALASSDIPALTDPRFALDHLLTGRPPESAVTGPFAWREGWIYGLTPDRPQLGLLDGPATVSRTPALPTPRLAAACARGIPRQRPVGPDPERRTAA